MRAMRKMMLVTRMRMFLKVSHLRIVCALKHKSKIEVFHPNNPILSGVIGLDEDKTNEKAGEAISSEQK